MSKKLLKESTIRRFGQLANMKAEVVSNFIGRNDSVVAEEEEEDLALGAEEEDLALDAGEDELALDAGEDELALDAEEDELDLGSDLDGIAAEEPGNIEMAERAILAVADALGVPVNIEGAAPAMGDELALDAPEDELALDAPEDELALDAEEDLEGLEETTETAEDTVEEATETTEDTVEEPQGDDALVNEIIRRVKARIASLSKD